VRGNGKAIAMAGWGHLSCPFMRPRSGDTSRFHRGQAPQDRGKRPGANSGGRLRSSGTPEARHTEAGKPKIKGRIPPGQGLVKYYY
jgi:hypothetical protein